MAEYWEDKWYAKSDTPWDIESYDKNLDSLFDKLKLKKKSKVLELGCGYGYDSKFFAEKGMIVDSIDISKTAINKAKKINKHKNISFKCLDFFKLAGVKQYDLIYDRGFIHNHQNILQSLFPKLYNFLSNKGKLLILSGNQNQIDRSGVIPTPMTISDIEKASMNFFNISLVKEIIFEQRIDLYNSLGWAFILYKNEQSED